MIFSIDRINEANNSSIPKQNVQVESKDFSFFENTLNVIMNEQIEFEVNLIQVNEGLLGKAAKHVVSKQFDKIKSLNIKDILSKILDMFVEAVQKLEEMFSVFLVSLINKNTRIKLYKNKLSNFNSSITFNKKNFDYSNILENNTFSSYESEITKVYDSFVDSLVSLNKATTPVELAKILSDIKDDSKYDSEDLDIIRGKLLSKNINVSTSDFADELFKYFRNGKSEPNKKSVISSTEVKKIAETYFDNKKQESIIKRESTKLRTKAFSLKAKIKTANIFTYVPDNVSINMSCVQDYNTIVNSKCRKIRDICDIYRLYYSAKIDALKEYNYKCRDILIEAIKEIVKEEAKKNDK